MKRRQFLIRMASLAGVSMTTATFAQSIFANSGHSGHNMGNMPTTNGNNMSMMGSEQHDMSMMLKEGYQLGDRILTAKDIAIMQSANLHLIDPNALPSGLILPALPKLTNQSTKAGHFKATLHAKPVSIELVPGKPTDFWAYNDSIPGQTIEVYEGDTVEIELINSLPQATTIHWHGLPVPPSQDGNPQDEVKPGEKHTYRFTLPVGSAGTYWYHPHGHHTVAEQAYRGLAGAFIVKAKSDPFAHLAQQDWLFSDLKLQQNGNIAANSFNDWMNGREGQFVLINGALLPQINIHQATRVRLWNACSARYLNLSLDDVDIYQIATDGGFIKAPVQIKTLLLTPGERAELVIIPKSNQNVTLQALAYNRGKMGMVAKEVTRPLAEVSLKTDQYKQLPQMIRSLPQYSVLSAYHHIEYTEVMNHNQLLFLINGQFYDMDRVDVAVKQNQVEEWTVFNNSHMDHNFHIHGTQFLIVEHELNGEKFAPRVNGLKDTVNLKPYETVTLRMIQSDQGLRMFHCHILEHESLGMMGQAKIS